VELPYAEVLVRTWMELSEAGPTEEVELSYDEMLVRTWLAHESMELPKADGWYS
jgi:hypothetical protein